ncbi:DUF3142 domain-containing protein [Pseudomonas corrugata]|uniref:DUF3142 domain-containing protein n=1 Tax=Pseudomonas corrugata TaxID=47879 RepID=UPI0015867BB0|nr:DUF3142 domain-containing protein [Pseudomonas corrugata]MCI0992750.1 DUF3142 domain-containing protein [Pseudomonas corrugata]NUT65919.1 DUF3142 domain-containing protein [Pseudomonas corrugata]
MTFLFRTSLALVALLLQGCEQPPAAPLDQQLYIWQRQWTPAHASALRQSHLDFSSLRVLALQAFPRAGWSRARIDPALLKADGRPLIAVIRLDGQLGTLDRDEVIAQIQQVLSDWQAQGLTPVGVEIDHDAGNARLPAYGTFLSQLRQTLPSTLRLSITALPAWLDSPALPGLLEAVDSSVLQVHAVSDPRQGLFDPKQARHWAERWSKVTRRPFYLALPAYGVALLTQESGVPVVESEVPIDRGGERLELLADPQQVAGLAADLRAEPPKHLAGLIWFRLPLAGDRRVWSLTTLGAVARGDKLDSHLALAVEEKDGLYDIRLANRGNLDSPWPQRVTLAVGACDGVDALAGYTLQQTPGLLTFTRIQEGRLAAGAQRAMGWARCTKIEQGAFNVYP